MARMNTCILFGGKSTEHEISLRSAVNVIKAMDRSRHSIIPVGIDHNGTWKLRESEISPDKIDTGLLESIIRDGHKLHLIPGPGREKFITETGKRIEVDAAFPVLHGSYGEDGTIQGLFAMLDLPFVGPDHAGSAIAMDKEVMKRLLRVSDIPSAKWMTLRKNDQENPSSDTLIDALGLPLFVKPARQGSSVGVSRAKDKEELTRAIAEAFRYDTKIIVEEAIEGREIECAVRGNEKIEASIPGEIIPTDHFYSYREKYSSESNTGLSAPADLSNEEVQTVRSLAIQTFRLLECEGLARVDMFLKSDGTALINEINTIPGFTSISMYPRLWEVSGLATTDLLNDLIDLAVQRHERLSTLTVTFRE